MLRVHADCFERLLERCTRPLQSDFEGPYWGVPIGDGMGLFRYSILNCVGPRGESYLISIVKMVYMGVPILQPHL